MAGKTYPKYKGPSWGTQLLPPESEERSYAAFFPDDLLVFILGKKDRNHGCYGYWMLTCSDRILDGRGVISRAKTGDRMLTEAMATIDTLEDFMAYRRQDWKKGWPAPKLIIINLAVSKLLAGAETDQQYFTSRLRNNFDRLNTIRDTVLAHHRGEIGEIIQRKKKREKDFYIAIVGICFIKTVSRNFMFYRKRERFYGPYPRNWTPADYVIFTRASSLDLNKRGIFGKIKPLSKLKFVDFVFSEYGEAKSPEQVLQENGFKDPMDGFESYGDEEE